MSGKTSRAGRVATASPDEASSTQSLRMGRDDYGAVVLPVVVVVVVVVLGAGFEVGLPQPTRAIMKPAIRNRLNNFFTIFILSMLEIKGNRNVEVTSDSWLRPW
jgi:hypothetical protein